MVHHWTRNATLLSATEWNAKLPSDSHGLHRTGFLAAAQPDNIVPFQHLYLYQPTKQPFCSQQHRFANAPARLGCCGNVNLVVVMRGATTACVGVDACLQPSERLWSHFWPCMLLFLLCWRWVGYGFLHAATSKAETCEMEYAPLVSALCARAWLLSATLVTVWAAAGLGTASTVRYRVNDIICQRTTVSLPINSCVGGSSKRARESSSGALLCAAVPVERSA